eukprot:2972987-Amphidinium_carterae.1
MQSVLMVTNSSTPTIVTIETLSCKQELASAPRVTENKCKRAIPKSSETDPKPEQIPNSFLIRPTPGAPAQPEFSALSKKGWKKVLLHQDFNRTCQGCNVVLFLGTSDR